MDFFNNLANAPAYSYATSRAYAAQETADDASSRAFSLEARLNRLTLVCAAMWELLQEKTGITPEQLGDRIRQIDLRDGKLDGKIDRTVRTCPACGRTIAPNHAKCMYCGKELPALDLFGKPNPLP
ncbi:MAG TPA: hypothetical protein VHQ47_04230 [Phycisphaerae bacterium]|jgi:hypothetical protein|nr:hypothetical protein [Phycisphaerae bacterium]